MIQLSPSDSLSIKVNQILRKLAVLRGFSGRNYPTGVVKSDPTLIHMNIFSLLCLKQL